MIYPCNTLHLFDTSVTQLPSISVCDQVHPYILILSLPCSFLNSYPNSSLSTSRSEILSNSISPHPTVPIFLALIATYLFGNAIHRPSLHIHSTSSVSILQDRSQLTTNSRISTTVHSVPFCSHLPMTSHLMPTSQTHSWSSNPCLRSSVPHGPSSFGSIKETVAVLAGTGISLRLRGVISQRCSV